MEMLIEYVETILEREMTEDEKKVFDIGFKNGRQSAIIELRKLVNEFK